MLFSEISAETFKTICIEFEDNSEFWKARRVLDTYKNASLVKGDMSVSLGNYRDGKYMGCIYACVRANAISSLYYSLKDHTKGHITHEVHTVSDEYIDITEPF